MISSRSKTFLGAALSLGVFSVAACEGGTESRPPAAIAAVSPVAQTAEVGTAVAAVPQVLVTDDRERPVQGVTVTFAVTAGGGSIAAPSVTTGADGRAGAGGWTLGTAAGAGTVTATAAGLPPVVFSATATRGAPAAMTVVSAPPETGTVGAALAPPLLVRVADANGNPVPAVAVTFTVLAGGGTLGTPAAATDANGRASTTLTLGRRPGPNTLSASAAGLPPVTSNTTARVGPATSLTRVAGDAQVVRMGTTVPVAPVVQAADEFGNPVPGAAVTFAVSAGGGSVTPSSISADSSGRAAASWTLGGAGVNTLEATAAGIPGVRFTATALDPCTIKVPLGARTTENGELEPSDCRLAAGAFIDYYQFEITGPGAEDLVFTSGSVDGHLRVYDLGGHLLAEDFGGAAATNSAGIRLFGALGRYTVGASSFGPGAVGPYQLSSRAPTAPTGCTKGWVVPDVVVTGELAPGDCTVSTGGRFETYLLRLRAGQQVTFTLRSAAFDSYLTLRGQGRVIANDDNSAPGGNGHDAQIVFTAPHAAEYAIQPRNFRESGGSTGDGQFTLTVTSP